jgi:hypothetical protein
MSPTQELALQRLARLREYFDQTSCTKVHLVYSSPTNPFSLHDRIVADASENGKGVFLEEQVGEGGEQLCSQAQA